MQCPGDGTCSNQGTCDVSTGTCTCNPGFLGPECSIIGKLDHFNKWWCHIFSRPLPPRVLKCPQSDNPSTLWSGDVLYGRPQSIIFEKGLNIPFLKTPQHSTTELLLCVHNSGSDSLFTFKWNMFIALFITSDSANTFFNWIKTSILSIMHCAYLV